MASGDTAMQSRAAMKKAGVLPQVGFKNAMQEDADRLRAEAEALGIRSEYLKNEGMSSGEILLLLLLQEPTPYYYY